VTAVARGLVLGPLLVALLAAPAFSQTSPCVKGTGTIKASALGTDVMREGAGFGAVSIGGSATDVERAWGPPGDCRPQGSSLSYQYFIESDTDDSALLLVVSTDGGRVDGILATLVPHSRGRGPSLRTGRGVRLVAPVDEVVRAYGTPPDPGARTWIYAADGVAFMPSKGVVAGIAVFKPGASPAFLAY
jgi:hypothetical protein